MFSPFNNDPFSILDNPMAKRLRENKIKLSEPPKIKELKSFKRLDDSRVPSGYKLFKGVALATEWVGPVTNPWIDEINLEIFKLESTTDSFELVWEWVDGDAGNLIKVQIDPKDQGNFFTLQRHLDICGKYLFKECGFSSFVGRAAELMDDVGVKGESDWRSKRVPWRRHRKTGEMIKITALHKMWLHCRWVVPFAMFNKNATEEQIAWLNPWKLSEMSEEELESLDDDLGTARRWRFADAKCLESG